MTVKSIPVSQSTTPLMALADAALSNGETSCSVSKRSQKSGVSTTSSPMDRLTFAQQIMKLLDDDASPYLKWMPEGKSFTIKNSKKFTSDEMPRLFNIRNMSSFVRKLTRWGFSRHHEKETMNFDIFKHSNFERGEWERCAQIKCAAPPQPAVSVTAIRNIPKMTANNKRPMSKPLVSTRPVSPVISSSPAAVTPPTTSPVQTRPKPHGHQWKPLVHPSLRNPPMPRSMTNNGAALKSMAERVKLDRAAARTNLLALQLIQEASQQQQQQQLHYDQALLQYWLARRHLPATINHTQLAAAALRR